MVRVLLAEALAVGVAFAILYISVASLQLDLPPWQTAFLAGVIGHLVFEALGLNSAFCKMM